MTLRHTHGAVRVETLQADEQPAGVPAPGATRNAPEARRGRVGGGKLASSHEGSQEASRIGRLGGLERARRAKQVRALEGLGLVGATPEWLRPYADDADQFCKAEVERLARECGGGVCPQNAAILVQQAALAMAGSRAAYASGEVAAGAKLGVEVRQNLLAAREITVLEAKARPHSPASRWLKPSQEPSK
jgi:hypothetical protein